MVIDIPKFDSGYLPEGYTRIEEGEFAGMICLESYLVLSPEQKKRICNGIGAATGLSSLMPSTIWGLDCSETGNIHDHGYAIGGTANDREVADKVFLHNLRVQISKGSKMLRWLRNKRAVKYYLGLRIGGSMHFHFTE
jgi:hypothetical protein